MSTLVATVTAMARFPVCHALIAPLTAVVAVAVAGNSVWMWPNPGEEFTF